MYDRALAGCEAINPSLETASRRSSYTPATVVQSPQNKGNLPHREKRNEKVGTCQTQRRVLSSISFLFPARRFTPDWRHRILPRFKIIRVFFLATVTDILKNRELISRGSKTITRPLLRSHAHADIVLSLSIEADRLDKGRQQALALSRFLDVHDFNLHGRIFHGQLPSPLFLQVVSSSAATAAAADYSWANGRYT